MPHTHDNVTYSSIDDVRCSCARAPALATGFPITCRRLGFRSGCCKYVEQCKTAIYWDLALDFTLVRLSSEFYSKTNRFIFSKKFQLFAQVRDHVILLVLFFQQCNISMQQQQHWRRMQRKGWTWFIFSKLRISNHQSSCGLVKKYDYFQLFVFVFFKEGSKP